MYETDKGSKWLYDLNSRDRYEDNANLLNNLFFYGRSLSSFVYIDLY